MQPYTSIQLPKIILRNEMLQEWHNLWDQGVTGHQVFAIIPRASLRFSSWFRKDTIFFSEHGRIPAYNHRFGFINNNFCSCGEMDTVFHYATECILTTSGHMRKPKINLL
ncbi:hypothetical protein AVEN_191045-1 [Araneus ventricosus]|uniref:Reverse transcriptase zinc-binding domain-containing protein n=1 Tax=Araneus ventricosus TaxID=182803 RepID=A0A4Y2AWY4_ARAVE|nr:hypothetical protein AVEN_191045-1 [Araneus ventricosus]